MSSANQKVEINSRLSKISSALISDVLDALVIELLEKETLDKAQIEEVFAALTLREVRPAWTGSTRRRPDERGPVATPSSNGYHGATTEVT